MQNSYKALNGPFKAYVENNNDPDKIGRVQIRIPHIHGIPNTSGSPFTRTDSLPWAYPSVPFYGVYDSGSFIIPPEGSYIWCMLGAHDEDDDDAMFIYIGGSYGKGSVNPKVTNAIYTKDRSMGLITNPAGENEVPGEATAGEYGMVGVIFKSQKGHTIYYDDTDGAEKFVIIDRAGQSIQFDCPVSKSDNAGNAKRRKTKTNVAPGSISMISGSSKVSITGDSITLSCTGSLYLNCGELNINTN